MAILSVDFTWHARTQKIPTGQKGLGGGGGGGGGGLVFIVTLYIKSLAHYSPLLVYSLKIRKVAKKSDYSLFINFSSIH